MPHPVLKAAEAELGARLDHRGDLALLDGPRRCLLISRAEKTPRPDSPWIRATVEAVRVLLSRGETLVSGAGRTGYDAALWVCAENSGRAIVALAAEPGSCDDLPGILPRRHLLVWLRESPKDTAAAQALRDRLMGELADRAFAIHVRKSGNMAALAARMGERNIPVESFKSAGSPAPPVIALAQFETGTLADRRILPDANGWDYLTHFTREPDGAWPGEERGAYLRWLCAGVPFAPRDAFGALRRILSEKRIRACGRLMPGGAPMVCFTALHPTQTIPLRRWRSGLLRWSFTRYGLAIRKGALQRYAAQAVLYQTREAMQSAPLDARRFMQLQKSGKYEWSAEAEWRAASDVDLSNVPAESLLALVATVHEASDITRCFGVRAVAIE